MPKVVYAFYSLLLLSQRGVPLVRKAHVTELQMFQLLACYRLLALNQIPTRAATASCASCGQCRGLRFVLAMRCAGLDCFRLSASAAALLH